MTRPEDALDLARAAAAKARAEGRYGDSLSGFAIEPTDRVSTEQLMEWAAIEPDETLMRSTRKLGAPITFVKRLMLRVMQQHFNELTSQQTRFNIHMLIHLAELEDRVTRLEEVKRAGPSDPERGGSA